MIRTIIGWLLADQTEVIFVDSECGETLDRVVKRRPDVLRADGHAVAYIGDADLVSIRALDNGQAASESALRRFARGG